MHSLRRFCFLLLISACASAQTDVPGWLHRGIEAFKAARYEDAMEYFQHAVDLDSNNVDAQMYLATAYYVQYIPGAPSPENLAFADKARSGYERVLSMQPDNKTALNYLGTISFQLATSMTDPSEKLLGLDASRGWYERLVVLDPAAKEAYYSLAVIDWMKWYPKWKAALEHAGIDPQQPAFKSSLRPDLGSSEHFVEDGMAKLTKALEIDPQYADAMAYMNLFVRERAFMDETAERYDKDVLLADDWVHKTMEARKAGGEESSTMAPPPPPPPPPPPAPVHSSAPKRIRVGGNVQAANLITKVVPKYPAKAKHDGIEGTVRFQAIIGQDGHILKLQVVRGDSRLVDAARDAVMQWVYKPTLLNGEPVEVVTTIDVNFTLNASRPPHM